MLGSFLEYIAKTNLFNFLIFLSIIIYLYKKFNVTALVEQAKDSVKATIDESSEAKSESERRLSSIEESFAHVGEEIEAILKRSEENARLVGEKIIQDANIAAETIKSNAEKSVENKAMLLKNELIKRASEASVEVAKSHILEELNNNSGLHDKLIDESIDAIEGVQS